MKLFSFDLKGDCGSDCHLSERERLEKLLSCSARLAAHGGERASGCVCPGQARALFILEFV